MCQAFLSPNENLLAKQFGVALRSSYSLEVEPLAQAPLITSDLCADVGQWGLIQQNWVTRDGPRRLAATDRFTPTVDRCTASPTLRKAWLGAQRCLIPIVAFDETYWYRGETLRLRFRARESNAVALAGLWSTWECPETRNLVTNFVVLTKRIKDVESLQIQPTKHALFKADKQSPNFVLPLSSDMWASWLNGPAEEARAVVQRPALEQLNFEILDA